MKFSLTQVWSARQPLSAFGGGRKVRTPQGKVPWVNQGSHGPYPTGTESVTENTHPVTFTEGDGRKVKWWCKRPPLRQQCWRHDKPHLVQDQVNLAPASGGEELPAQPS